jgi:DNA-binding response OmpR family regulator
MGPNRIRCAIVLIADDDRSVQLLARLSRSDGYAVALTVCSAAAARHRNARMLARLLRADGYLVDSSLGGWEGIELLTQRPRPDVLIIDVDAQSQAVAPLIRHAHAVSPGLVVLVVTDRADEIHEAIAGIVPEPFVLEKPVDYAALRRSLLSSRPRSTSEIVAIRGDTGHAASQAGRNRR